MRDLRLVYSISSVCLILMSSFGMSDDRQKLLRFLGHGWGAGYHAYPPQCGQGCGQCLTDRYSHPNFPRCNPQACGSAYPHHVPNPSNSLYGAPHSMPAYSNLEQRQLNSTFFPQNSPYRIPPSRSQSAPLKQQQPVLDLESAELPMISVPSESKTSRSQQKVDRQRTKLQPPASEKQLPPPENSGTTENPFGVDTSYLIPQQKYSRGRPVNPLQVQMAVNPFQKPKLHQSAGPGNSPSRFRQRSRTNTFNGIR